MKSYAEAEIFTASEVRLLHLAERMVKLLPDAFDPGLRCHELARAVAICLNHEIPSLGERVHVDDGKFCYADHSWIVLPPRLHILDVYAVGSLPPVQLVDVRSGALGDRTRCFRKRERRTDIDDAVVDRIVRLFRPGPS